MREGALDRRKKKPGLKCNPGLTLTGVSTTGPSSQIDCRKFFFLVFNERISYVYTPNRNEEKKKKKKEEKKIIFFDLK